MLAGRSDVLRAFARGIEAIGHDTARLQRGDTSPCATLREHAIDPAARILVEGTPRFIADPANVDRIRRCCSRDPLDSAVATARRQQRRLFFRHRQYAMMARQAACAMHAEWKLLAAGLAPSSSSFR